MNPLLLIAIRFAAILTIAFFAIQPFNWFCQISQKCQPFFLSYYFPKEIGKQIKLSVNALDYSEKVEFTVLKPEGESYTNWKTLAIYHVKNISKKTINFRPALIVEPKYVEKYLIRYQCLCLHKYRLKAGEEIDMKMEFMIDKKIENDERFNKDELINIGYKI